MSEGRIVPVHYEPNGTWGICDRCGFKCRLRELSKDWQGLMVCSSDFDPKPDTLNPPRVMAEGLAVPRSKSEQPDTFITLPVAPADL